jgi:alpha-L-rhamnosidase
VFSSSATDTGSFACSSAPLNRLWSNILWTQRANLMSAPTDCPQRDERLGWMGDIQVFSRTALFNQDVAAFFTKWLADVRDAQTPDGRFPDFAPHPFGPNERFSAAPAWGDAGVFVPWQVYLDTGDTRLLADSFEAARRWVDYVARLNPDHVWRHGRGNDYNDWLNGDTLILADYPKHGGEIPKDVFATAFYARSARLTARMAEVLGKADEARRYGALADEVRAAFQAAFVDGEGRITGDTQAGYALALNFDLLPDGLRPKAVEHLTAALARCDGRLSTGIQSTLRLMLELSRAGRDDLAYALLTSHHMPSWLYSVDQGATTVWERWDGYVAGRGFQDPGMNSLNHWAFGAVGEWMYRVMLGLELDESAPGWRHFTLRPRPGGGVTWARGGFHSLRGEIGVAWTAEPAFKLTVDVPPNTRATVILPDGERHEVGSGRHDFGG